MDVLVHHILGQNIISLARNKAEADNNVKEYNGITILYLMGEMIQRAIFQLYSG
jgi:hypothetical protein